MSGRASPADRPALGRTALLLLVLLIGLLALAPLAALLLDGLLSAEPGAGGLGAAGPGTAGPGTGGPRAGGLGAAGLGADGAAQIRGTLLLVAGEGLLGTVLGTATGWLTAVCRFPGRRWLRMAQLLPLACPAYLLAASLIDWGSQNGIRIHGFWWAVLLLSLANYTYVFLLSTESFAMGGGQLLEACRSLGVGPWGSFWRVALPLAAPSIGAGVALSAMEVVNELGAVRLLGVPSLSAGILNRWQIDGDPRGAALLALIALAIVVLLLAAERALRRRSRRWNPGNGGACSQVWPLMGWRAAAAIGVTLLPPLACLLIPGLWILQGWQVMAAEPLGELLALAGRSLGLALLVTAITALCALLLAISRRWSVGPLVPQFSLMAGLGYGIPGSVLALGLLLVGGPLQLNPVLLLVWGYGVRFMAVSKQGLDAALERIPTSIDESATSLGCSWWQTLGRIHLPLLRGPLLVGLLLVFVDVVKELPITLSLRPFDFDTLAVRVFQYASDERVGYAMAPALLIIGFGLLAAIALIPSLEERS